MNETPTITLADLNAGDTAITERGGGYTILREVTIAKITATQIVCENGDRYRLSDGRLIGNTDHWTSDVIYPATGDILARYRRQRNLSTVKNVQWDALDNNTLAAVVALLPRKGV